MKIVNQILLLSVVAMGARAADTASGSQKPARPPYNPGRMRTVNGPLPEVSHPGLRHMCFHAAPDCPAGPGRAACCLDMQAQDCCSDRDLRTVSQGHPLWCTSQSAWDFGQGEYARFFSTDWCESGSEWARISTRENRGMEFMSALCQNSRERGMDLQQCSMKYTPMSYSGKMPTFNPPLGGEGYKGRSGGRRQKGTRVGARGINGTEETNPKQCRTPNWISNGKEGVYLPPAEAGRIMKELGKGNLTGLQSLPKYDPTKHSYAATRGGKGVGTVKSAP